jgi:hypothetical protein
VNVNVNGITKQQDSFGQVVSNNIKSDGLAVQRAYGLYALHDNAHPIVYHADGRRYHAGGHPATRVHLVTQPTSSSSSSSSRDAPVKS